MLNFILQLIVFSSLGLLVYLVARAVPRLPESLEAPRRANIFDRVLAKIPTAKIDENLNSYLAKFLRKFRVVLMKLDNFVKDRLGKVSKKVPPSENGGTSQDQEKSVL